jgi:hypothetical protein
VGLGGSRDRDTRTSRLQMREETVPRHTMRTISLESNPFLMAVPHRFDRQESFSRQI